jgi:Domain of unknown function (DUF4160)
LDSVYRTFVADCGEFLPEIVTFEIMPTVLRLRGFRFFFYSNEGSPREPAHIHVEKDRCEAKFWLRPETQIAYNDGYDARTLRELSEIVAENRNLFERAWDEFFG